MLSPEDTTSGFPREFISHRGRLL
uniref:Uncharacterized protein n=1 Tax=Anguilla anguilla TaxID=7936 RepID=A0A0E9U6T8_ANGAN